MGKSESKSDIMWQLPGQNTAMSTASFRSTSNAGSFQSNKSNSIQGYRYKDGQGNATKYIRIGSLNICRGLFKKEVQLKYTIQEQNIDIIGISEVDLLDFDEKKPFKIEGFNTFFPLQCPGSNKKRLLCFVKEDLEVTQRDDLMSPSVSNVWIEMITKSQKILICTTYREFNKLDGNGPLNTNQEIEHIHILKQQIEIASKEGLVIIIGDMNIDLHKMEMSKITKQAEEYQLLIGECGLDLIDFGSTWFRKQEYATCVRNQESALDHALVNKPEAIKDFFKIQINNFKTDHNLICVDVKTNVQKITKNSTTTRDYRKVRSNPKFFLKRLIWKNWNVLGSMSDVDDMVNFYSEEVNNCLDECAPWKTRKYKKKKFQLSKEVLEIIQMRNELQKELQKSINNGITNKDMEIQYKKHNNYCNKMIKKEVKQKTGENITSDSNMKEIWKCINIVLKPETSAKNKLKIKINNETIEDPQTLADNFNNFFAEKVQKLSAGIKKSNSDPLLLLKEKMKSLNIRFKIKTVNENHVTKILKELKAKKSYGQDGITAEILKISAEVLKTPLTHIVNTSISSSKYPTKWKISKLIPLHKKGSKLDMNNYRPLSLLCVAGMVLERVVAIQIEEYFESNGLLGTFQFGFRKNKSSISELLTLFDSLLEGKENKKEIMVILYDLSAAFDTVSHEILLAKLEVYGFDNSSLNWIKSYLKDRYQYVQVSEKKSKMQVTNIGTPQGSRLSPILFLCLMADMDLWAEDSKLSNFADDTQSIIIRNEKEDALESTKNESKNMIDFFSSNNFVNNANKAALIYNSGGKGSEISIDIGGEMLNSTYTEKLLGLHINADFKWNSHIDEISKVLRQRIGQLKRIKQKIPQDKLIIIAEAIFNSIIRYGIAVYLIPTYEKEELKARKLNSDTYSLQTIQNNMLRVIHGLRISDRVNMQELRQKIEMMSVNQMAIYHTTMEVFNIVYNSSSEQIQNKFIHQDRHSLRKNANNFVKVPEEPKKKCMGFTYYGAKVFNSLPNKIRETQDKNTFKSLMKDWIWEKIPSY